MLIRTRFVVKEGGTWVARCRILCVWMRTGWESGCCMSSWHVVALFAFDYPLDDPVLTRSELRGLGAVEWIRDEALMSCAGGWASSLYGDRTNGRRACPVSGANHCLLVSFPLCSELLSRTAQRGRQIGELGDGWGFWRYMEAVRRGKSGVQLAN